MSFKVQSFRCTYNTITYIHGAFPLAFLTPCWFSFAHLCVPFEFPSTYLAPSSCDRNRHLPLRLLVNWPRLPHPSPNWPTLPKFLEPHLPAPNNDDLGNILALAIRNKNVQTFRSPSQLYLGGSFILTFVSYTVYVQGCLLKNLKKIDICRVPCPRQVQE